MEGRKYPLVELFAFKCVNSMGLFAPALQPYIDQEG